MKPTLSLHRMITFCCIIFSVLLVVVARAQEVKVPQIIPPSPDAASLGKFGDIKVGAYTGTSNISIPIYTATCKNASTSIQLAYNSGGIRVEEEASWVGLGWSLKAGGVITRSVRGLDDFLNGMSSKGYYYAGIEPNNSPGYLNDVCEKTKDSEPDVFYYNFDGHSGKFFHSYGSTGQFGDPGHARLLVRDKLKIFLNPTTSVWTIRTWDGTQYIFGTKEYTTTWSGSGATPSFAYNAPISAEDTQLPVVSSWYLDKIISPTGEEINFTYTTVNPITGIQYRSRTAPNVSEVRSFCVGLGQFNTFSTCPLYNNPFGAMFGSHYGIIEAQRGYTNSFDFDCIYDHVYEWQWHKYSQGGGSTGSGGCGGGGGLFDNNDLMFSGSFQVHNNVYLSEISYKNGKVIFKTSDRDDILRHTDEFAVVFAKPQKLDSVIVQHYNDGTYRPIKKFAFTYDYFNANSTGPAHLDKRLKLQSIRESNGSVLVPPYQFFYHQTATLPRKDTRSKDHWGFYNGAYNDVAGLAYQPTIIPPIRYTAMDGSVEEIPGANREANEALSKAGVLEKIIYPTKGFTEFTYESNSFNINEVSSNLPTKSHWFQVETPYSEATVFDLTEPALVTVNAEFKCLGLACHPGGTPPDPTVNCDQVINSTNSNYYFTIKNIATNEIVYKGQNYEYFCKNGQGTCTEPDVNVTPCGISKQKVLALLAGRYLIKLSPVAGFKANVTASYNLHQAVTSYSSNVIVKGGGLRINQVKVHDGLSTANDKITRYKYETKSAIGAAESTGKLMSFPKYAYGEYYKTIELNNDSVLIVKLRTHSYSNSPLGSSAQGSAVGYDRVEEIHGPNGENGKTVHYFKNDPEEELSPFFPNAPNRTRFASNGLLTKQEVFDFSNFKLKEINNFYSQAINPSALKGVMLLKYSGGCYDELVPYNQWFFAYKYYEEASEWWFLVKTIQKDFDTSDPQNLSAITSQTDLTYTNAHMQVILETSFNSNGDRIDVKTRYPLDTTQIVPAAMINKYMHGYPVVTERKVNYKRASGAHNVYQYDATNDFIKLVRIDEALVGGNYIPRINLTYDNEGNIVQLSKADDIVTAFIWGYNKTLPIAKVVNATIAQVEAALPPQDLIDLHGNTLTAAQIKQKLAALYAALPQAQVSIYTYEPLVGIATITDENNISQSFTYDDLKRLIAVMDNDLQPIMKYKYQYKQN